MPLTRYDGRQGAVNISGNTLTVLMPAVADPDLKTVTMAEITADTATAIDCSIRSLAPSASASTKTDQFLCEEDAEEQDGSLSWSIDTILLQVGDPQAPNAFLDSLHRGQTVYLAQRWGLPNSTDPAAGQRLAYLCKATVQSIVPQGTTANADGDKFQVGLNLAVKKMSDYSDAPKIAA